MGQPKKEERRNHKSAEEQKISRRQRWSRWIEWARSSGRWSFDRFERPKQRVL